MMAFVDTHRKAFGVESICTALQIAPSGYYRRLAVQHKPDCAAPGRSAMHACGLTHEQSKKGSMDVTAWLKWFVGALERSVTNARQIKMLNRLLDGFDGKLTSSRWASIAKCSPDSALRDITQLIDHGILEKTSGGGRSTAYRLASNST
jgi:hypothetical protein